MANHYVNTATGSDDTGDGSAGNPWKTWDHAASQFPFPAKYEEMYKRLNDVVMIEEMYKRLHDINVTEEMYQRLSDVVMIEEMYLNLEIPP